LRWVSIDVRMVFHSQTNARLVFVTLMFLDGPSVARSAFVYLFSIAVAAGLAYVGLRRTTPTGRLMTAVRSACSSVAERQAFWRYSLYKLAALLGTVGNQTVDLLVLSLIAAPESVGLYAAAMSFVAPISVVGAAAGIVALPRVAGSAQGPQTLGVARRFFTYTLVVSASASLVAFGLAPTVIPALFGSAFDSSVPVARVLAIGAVALSMTFLTGAILRGLGRPSVVAIGQIAGAVATVALVLVGWDGHLPWVAVAATGGYLLTLAIKVTTIIILSHTETDGRG
jgi:O-antigen/teichoic acid export membrane protein